MKEVWLFDRADRWKNVKEKVKDAVEIGYDGVLVRKQFEGRVRKLGRIKTASIEDSIVEIETPEKQGEAVRLSRERDYLFLFFPGWRVIPLENIIAMKKSSKLVTIVESPDEAKIVLTTLEKGADGIAVDGSREELLEYYRIAKGKDRNVELKKGKIVEIRPLGIGERVCIDTVTLMKIGEGMLVGNKASFMFLVASESEESEYVASRPFRVNAGSVNGYIMVGQAMKYLAELKSGDGIEVVRYDGKIRQSYVGRAKIERRPLVLVRAIANGDEGTVILQNAETIKLVSPEGTHVSIADLKEGDEVLVWLGVKGRHFGIEIDEFIIEK